MKHDQAPFRTLQAASPPDAIDRDAKGINGAWLLAALLALFAIDTMLVPVFLGLGPMWCVACAAAMVPIVVAAARVPLPRLPARRVAACAAAGVLVMVAGGQGGLLFANADWLVRDAVLRDMTRFPWPYLYAGHGAPLLLRAPIGMYLLPALAGKLGGDGVAAATLLLQNGAAAGLVLALGSLLFDGARARRIALLVVLAFSGMDTLGQMLVRPESFWPLDRHIEGWTNLEYSSTITLAFWVPQHALAGWTGALLFLLWRSGRLPLFAPLAAVPLGMIWSPLAEIGMLPFAALAGVDALVRRGVTLRDVALPALACAAAWTGLQYMHVDPGSLPLVVRPVPALTYATFMTMEVLPFVAIIAVAARGGRFGIATFAVVVGSLLALPFARMGVSVDLEMRASIPALAVLAVLSADVVIARRGLAALLMAAVLLVGALTPLRELLRAVDTRPAPATRCDLWTGSDIAFPQFGKENYFANATLLPALLRPVRSATLVAPIGDGQCWPRPWATPRWRAPGNLASRWPLPPR